MVFLNLLNPALSDGRRGGPPRPPIFVSVIFQSTSPLRQSCALGLGIPIVVVVVVLVSYLR